MEAGKLRHLAQLQTYSESQDSFGQVSKSYSTAATRYCEIRQMYGKELVHAQQVQPQAQYKIRMRYYPLTPRDRIVFNSRNFELLSVENVEERNKETICLAVEQL